MNVNECAQQRSAPGPPPTTPSSISPSHSYNITPNPALSRPTVAQTPSTTMMASTSSSAPPSSFSPLPVAVPNHYYATQQQQHYSTQAQPHQPSAPSSAVNPYPVMQFHQGHHPYPSHHPLSSSPSQMAHSNPSTSATGVSSYRYPPPPQQSYPPPSSYPPQQSQGFPPTMGYTTKPGPGPGIAPLFPRTLSSSSSYSAASTSTSAAAAAPFNTTSGTGTGNSSSELVSPASALSEPSVRTPASADGLGFPPSFHGPPSSSSTYSSVHVGGVGVGGGGHGYQHQSQTGPYAQANPALPSPHVTVAQPPTPSSMMMPGSGTGGGGVNPTFPSSQSNMGFGTGGMGPPLLQEQFTGKTIHTPEDMNEYRRMLSAAQRRGQMQSFDTSSGAGVPGSGPGPGGIRSRSGSAIGSGAESSPVSRTGTAASYRSQHPPAPSTTPSSLVASHPYYPSSSHPHHQAPFQQQQQRTSQPYTQGIMTNNGYHHSQQPPPPSSTSDIMISPSPSSSTGANAPYWHASAPPSSITDHKIYLPTPNNPISSSSSISPPTPGFSAGGPGGVTQPQQYGNGGAPYGPTTHLPTTTPAPLVPHSGPAITNQPTLHTQHHHHHHHQVPHLPHSIRTRKPERPKLLIEQSFSPPPGTSAATVDDGNAFGSRSGGSSDRSGQAGARSDTVMTDPTSSNAVDASANTNKAASPSAPTSAIESSGTVTVVNGGEPNSRSTSANAGASGTAGDGNVTIYASLDGFVLPGPAVAAASSQSGTGTSASDSKTILTSPPPPGGSSNITTAHRSSASGGNIHEFLPPPAAVADPNGTTAAGQPVSSSASATPQISSVLATEASATQHQHTPSSPVRLESDLAPDVPNSSGAVGPGSPSPSVSPHASVGNGTAAGESGQKTPEAEAVPPTLTSTQPSSNATPSAFLQSRTLQHQQQTLYQQQLMQHHWRQHAVSLAGTRQNQQAQMAARQQQALAGMALQPPAPLPDETFGAPTAGYATQPSQQQMPSPFLNYPQNAPALAIQPALSSSQAYPSHVHDAFAHGAPGEASQQPPPSAMRQPSMNVNMGMPTPTDGSGAGQFSPSGDQYGYSNPIQTNAHVPGYPTMPPTSQHQRHVVQRPGWQVQPGGHAHSYAPTSYGQGPHGMYGPYVPPPPLQYGAYRQDAVQHLQPGYGYPTPQAQSQRGYEDGPPPPYEAHSRISGDDAGGPMILASLPGQPSRGRLGQPLMQSSSSFEFSGSTTTATSSTPTTPANQIRVPRSPQRGRRTPFFMRPPTPEPKIPGQPKIERFHPISDDSKMGGELKYVGFEIHEAYALSTIPITHHYKFAADRGAKGATARAANNATATGSAHGNGAATHTKKRKAPSSSRRSGRRTTNARKPMMLDDTDEDVPGTPGEGPSVNNGPPTPKPLRPRRKASEKIFNASLTQPEEDEDDEYFSDEDEPEKEDSDDDYVDDAPVRPAKKRGRRVTVSDEEEDHLDVQAARNAQRDAGSVVPLIPLSPSRTKSGRATKLPRSPNTRREPAATSSGRSGRK